MLLELRNVVAGYESAAPTLKGASLTLSRGQRIAILGRNACGKSTLLRVASGLMRPLSGEMIYNGTTAPAFLLQNPREQLICATVTEEIDLALRMNRVAADQLENRKRDLLVRFGLQDMSEVAPSELSGGQQQRLALAALFCRELELLLLDEPDAFLDGRSRREFRDYVGALPKEIAVLWTVCRRSEIPGGFESLELREGTLHRPAVALVS